MLVACRLAGLSAHEAHYADDNAQAQSGVEENRSDADVILRIAVQKYEAGKSETASDLKVDVRGLRRLGR
jgi:hypothetical protein